ncbi:unnamed protein product [Protopolystoma xenopodis]|uniref:Uncharacterized protein n=1 Tax=Protopolystoma xenopodis TaxID=117903 RepID=A0A448WYD4_9PLAT|nr:unnamed protein product [Protopolystoma xenopodis]
MIWSFERHLSELFTLHAVVITSVFTLVLRMLIRVCLIVTQSSCPRPYHSLSLAPLDQSALSLVHSTPATPICATRGVIRPPLRLGD